MRHVAVYQTRIRNVVTRWHCKWHTKIHRNTWSILYCMACSTVAGIPPASQKRHKSAFCLGLTVKTHLHRLSEVVGDFCCLVGRILLLGFLLLSFLSLRSSHKKMQKWNYVAGSNKIAPSNMFPVACCHVGSVDSHVCHCRARALDSVLLFFFLALENIKL